jgi:hypothetical protein
MRRRLAALVKKLRATDPDIVEILQFGSSVYAPRLARDVDLLVTTRAKKAADLYWDAVESFDRAVDILVREPGQRMSPQIALSVHAFSKSLFGNGQTQKEAKEFMGIPTYNETRNYLMMADEDLERAHQAKDPLYRDARYRLAFDLLVDAARYAAMTFLATDEKRWGKLPDKLPAPFKQQFREFISVLHIQYGYDDKFPRDQADEKFKEWRGKVSAFIDALAARSDSRYEE